VNRLLACAILSFLASTVQAQKPDCPHLDAARPMRPPGPPPPFPPPMGAPPKTLAEALATPPATSRELSWDDLPPESRAEWDRRMEDERRRDWIVDAEEGFIASTAWEAAKATPGPLPPALHAFAIPADKLSLAGWTFLGFRQTGRLHVHRYFRAPEGSLLEIDEWAYKEMGGAIYGLPGASNVKVADRPARLGGLRGPSGCVSSSLSWHDDRVKYALLIVGPLDVAAQRRRLEEVAASMAAATR
jgi:hypothetical protein